MRFTLTILLSLLALSGFGQSTNKTPINRGILQSDLDGAGKKITNATVLLGGANVTITTNAQGLPVIAATGGGGGGSQTPLIADVDAAKFNVTNIGKMQATSLNVSNNTYSLNLTLNTNTGVAGWFNATGGGHQITEMDFDIFRATTFIGALQGNATTASGAPPTGTASGVLQGTYPSPTLVASTATNELNLGAMALQPTNAPLSYNGTNTGNFWLQDSGVSANDMRLFWGPNDSADIWYNETHSVEPEWQFGDNGSISFTIGIDNQAKADGHFGGSGAYHSYWRMQYDDPTGGLTSVNNMSHSTPFGFTFAVFNGGGRVSHYNAFVAQPTDTNGGFNLEWHDRWNGQAYGYQQSQRETTDHIAGYFTSNNITWGGLSVSNGITDGGPTTNRLAVFINNTISNAPSIADGQVYKGDTATAGGIKAVDMFNAQADFSAHGIKVFGNFLDGSNAGIGKYFKSDADGLGSWGSLAATDLTGTIADARLSANVPLLNVSNIFTAGISNSGGLSVAGNVYLGGATNTAQGFNFTSNISYTTSSGKPVAISGSNIDASLSDWFTKTLSGNTPFVLQNMTGGRTVNIKIANPSGFTFTWTGVTFPSNYTANTTTPGTTVLTVGNWGDGTNLALSATNFP